MFDQKFPDLPDQGHNKKKGTDWAAPQRAALRAKAGQVARQFCGYAHERSDLVVLNKAPACCAHTCKRPADRVTLCHTRACDRPAML